MIQPYVPSPLLYDGMLFFFKHYQGVLLNVDAKTGKTHFGPERIPGIRNLYASPAGASGRVYVLGQRGGAVVLKRAAELQVLSQSRLDDSFAASPAIVGDALYLRGREHLYCIARDSAKPAKKG